MTKIRIDCRDPIVSRDGRPFGKDQGNKMRSLAWPLPSVVAGSLRTAIGKAASKEFNDATSKDLFGVAVAGVFPVVEELYLPAPNDCVLEEEIESPRHAIYCARPSPMKEAEGCDIPSGLDPVLLHSDSDFKPKPAPAWWPARLYAKWLTESTVAFDHTFLKAPEVEERTHVVMDAERGAGIEGELFSTSALPLTDLPRYRPASRATTDRYARIHLAARAEASGWCGEELAKLDTLHPLGGERRLVHWQADVSDDLWQCPTAVSAALNKNTKYIRMVLATPAIFEHGWKPGWLSETGFIGSVPETNVKLKLVGFTIQRWKAVSGWSYQPQVSCAKPGPKPVRRMVPAGGVYFFIVEEGEPLRLAERWLRSVCDNEQVRRDGFGLACWGVWEPTKEK